MTALQEVRSFTVKDPEEALAAARKRCNDAGVALAMVERLPHTALSGATWWLSPRKPVIALSLRHQTDDHLWFSFFHEAAHILLHSKKQVFVEGKPGTLGNKSSSALPSEPGEEREANQWAANFLVPPSYWSQFVAGFRRSKAEVNEFAERLAIAPGIVVGRLQHEGHLPHTHMNGLKTKVPPLGDR